MTDINHYHPHHPPSPPPPADHQTHDPHGPHSPRNFIKKLTEKVDFGEDVDFVVGVTATALTADQLVKQTTCKDHKVMHLAKAGLGAAVAATAFTMMSREHDQRKHDEKRRREKEMGHKNNHRDHRHHHSPRRLLSQNRHHEEEESEWAVVRSRSPDRYEHIGPKLSRSASVGAGTTHRRYYYERNPEYYEDDDDSDYEYEYGPPYPDDHERRRNWREHETSRRRRAYSHGDTGYDDRRGRSESPGALKRIWKVFRDGMENYERYDRGRRYD